MLAWRWWIASATAPALSAAVILAYRRVCYNPKSADACGNSGATLYGCLPFDGSEDAKVTGNYTDVLCQAFDWLDMSRPEVEERVPWNT